MSHNFIGYKKVYRGVLNELSHRLPLHYGNNLTSAVVFGSVARDTFSPQSDIDLLIILNGLLDRYEVYERLFDMFDKEFISIREARQRGFFFEINPIVLTKSNITERIPYLFNRDFIILFDREGFFKGLAEGIDRFVRERLVYHNKGMPYFEVCGD